MFQPIPAAVAKVEREYPQASESEKYLLAQVETFLRLKRLYVMHNPQPTDPDMLADYLCVVLKARKSGVTASQFAQALGLPLTDAEQFCETPAGTA